MSRRLPALAVVALLVALGAMATAAPSRGQGDASVGRLVGRVLGDGGAPLAGVTVVARGPGGARARAVSALEGAFALEAIAAGDWEVELRLGERKTPGGVFTVGADATTEAVLATDWRPAFAETLTVSAASRYAERVVDAPAAVTTVDAAEIGRQAAHGQLPRLLAGGAGVEMAEGGTFDVMLNARGFNGFVNRQVLTLIDGRDPSIPVFSGGQEWASASFPLDELESVELVRGPGAALYGAGAFNGVLNLVTKSSRSKPEGRLRFAAGERETRRGELRWVHPLGDAWGLKLVGTYQEGGGFARSRVDGVEYEPDLLARERAPLPDDEPRVAGSGVRLDGDLERLGFLTFEAGTAEIADTPILTGIGRTLRTDVDRPWARVAWSGGGTARGSTTASAWWTGRGSRHELNLASGSEIFLDEDSLGFDLQHELGYAGGRGRLVGGVSWGRLEVDSADDEGRQTVFADTQEADRVGLFAQTAYDLADPLQAVASLRYDESDLHDSRWSPRLALVYAVTPRQTVRASWGEAFQSPTLAELHLQAAVGPALDLSGLEIALAGVLGGVPLGLEAVPILAVGNPDLEVEEVESFEIGYRAIVGESSFVTVNLFRNELSSFVSALLPQVGTSFGRLNRFYGPYVAPAALSPEAAAIVEATLHAALPAFLSPFLSTGPAGETVIALLSFADTGAVTTEGLEASLTVSKPPWSGELTYAYLDFEVVSAPESPLSPNSPRHRVGVTLAYVGGLLDGSLRWRWSEAFDWVSGIFVGPVPEVSVVDLSLGVPLRDRWRLGVEVSNLLDDEHWQVFGGDLLGRRALASVTYTW